jgi:hypothetical protein
MLSRRQAGEAAIKTLTLFGGALVVERLGSAHTSQAPPSTVTILPREFGPNAPPTT